jgi:hypothetical protein
MTGSSRIMLRACCLLAAFTDAGCRTDAPLPLPDAARSSGLRLDATPQSLVIRPFSSGRLKFVLRDEQGLPVSDYPLAFTIVSDSSGDGTADAQLSSNQGLTDSNGEAVLEIIVGNLTGDSRSVLVSVNATCPGSGGALAKITVTTNAYSVEIAPLPATDILGSVSLVSTSLLFYEDTTCGELDLAHLNAAPTRPRPLESVEPNKTATFWGVAESGSNAVVGLGLDSSNVVQIAGCVDIPGQSLFDSVTIRATLYMDLLFPRPEGTFQVTSDFQQSVTMAPTLTAIKSVWQQWARCPLDPARLWIDYTLDALASDETSDPTLYALLSPLRGTVVTPLAGASTESSDPPCHSPTNSAGDPSLESLVDNLFSNKRDQLSGAALANFSGEIDALLDSVHIDSKMTIAATNTANSYVVEHDLLSVTFPKAISSISLKTANLGLPISSVSGILATLKGGQLSIPSHGFTARLGTLARYAFEGTSIKSRGAEDAPGLVKAVFGLAQWSDHDINGCDALDIAMCQQIQKPTGCLFEACQNGLAALAANLAEAFDALDGSGIDFSLFGSAPVVDLDENGQADTLGLGGRAGTSSAGTGGWWATLSARSVSYDIYGTWTASRVVVP